MPPVEKGPLQTSGEIPKIPVAPSTTPKNPEQHFQTLRTYEGDVAEAVTTNKASTISIALAEARKKEGQKVEKAEGALNLKNTFILIAGILLIGGGIFAAIFFYGKVKQQTPIVTLPASPTLLVVDREKSIDVTTLSGDQILSQILTEKTSTDLAPNLFEAVTFFKTSSTSKTDLTAEEFLQAIAPSAPTELFRSLRPDFSFGFHIYGNHEPFLILETDSYQNAFAAMLQFEENLPDELGGIFLASTASGTTPAFRATNFKDMVIQNHDARVLTDANTGEISFLYTFLDKNTLVMTTNETTLSQIIERIHSKRLTK